MEPNQVVDFESSESHFFLNPRASEQDKSILSLVELPSLPGHIWLTSSGTTQKTEIKLIALSKNAFLVAAAASNRHLGIEPDDVWYKNLPDFHVGGLSILARAHLAKTKVIDDYANNIRWEAKSFVARVNEVRATLISLVPTQVYDLVHAGLKAPAHIRAILVGGGALPPDLFVEARQLGWPLLPTYGMSEVCSQIATAPMVSLDKKKIKFPEAIVLDHIETRTHAEGLLEIKSEALFTTLAYAGEKGLRLEDPKVDGWYRTTDKVDLDVSCVLRGRTCLRFIGRNSDLVKVNGELVSLAKVQSRFNQRDAVVVAKEDARMGHRLCVATTTREYASFEKKVKDFNQASAPFERILAIYFVDEIPRSALGKVKVEALKDLLGRG